MGEPLATGSISARLYPHDLPAAQQLEELRHQARAAVAAGYDGVMVSEHHADFPGYLPNPQQMAGFLLAEMPQGWAAPCPMLLPVRPWGLAAEHIAWLAAAYPGRVGVGFAAGALAVDFEVAEVPFGEIGERFKAALPKVVAALRGQDPGPLGADRALRRCAEHPVPMVVAAQSPPAVRRAANLGVGILYDSLQTDEASRRLSDLYDEAGGPGPKILIRRVWIGPAPEAAIAAQVDRYRSYAPQRAVRNWGEGDATIRGDTAVEVAEALAASIDASGCDAVNVRIHVSGLPPAAVRDQLELHGAELLPALRRAWSGARA